MEDWQQEWSTFWDGIAEEVEQWLEGVAKEMNEATDALIEVSEAIAEQLHQVMGPSLDQLDEQMSEWMEPFAIVLTRVDAVLLEAAQPVTQTVEPLLNQHPHCVGCRNYHGQMYGGEMLVCAMHPYGVAEGVEECPDKDAMM
jgi:hypothetical protein